METTDRPVLRFFLQTQLKIMQSLFLDYVWFTSWQGELKGAIYQDNVYAKRLVHPMAWWSEREIDDGKIREWNKYYTSAEENNTVVGETKD